ncbi:Aste57867_15316 [Aphanomyces stellatus]|uniref:Aste57867_15316 protein n=1 Tax=Aphanomyces stellatus TaxID=120398 RepID=A0A485L4Q3_9STRA|nr:hypothetical protein As57867_015260 [Aphanomyces stellatus]VFT92125.1 Aste57867_15316 [Aphanomyces stellatus]
MSLAEVDLQVLVEGLNGGDATAATEYKTTVSSDGKVRTSYIEAKVDCEYWVRSKLLNADALSATNARTLVVTIDGVQVANRVWQGTCVGGFDDIKLRTSMGFRNFKFRSPEFAQDGESSTSKLSKVGSIVVDVYHSTVEGKMSNLVTPMPPDFLTSIHDESKAGAFATATTSLGNSTMPVPKGFASFKTTRGELLFSGRFVYKTRDALEMDGIVPIVIAGPQTAATILPSPTCPRPTVRRVPQDVVEFKDKVIPPTSKRLKTERMDTRNAASQVVDLTRDDANGPPILVAPGAISGMDHSHMACLRLVPLKNVLGDDYMPAMDMLTEEKCARAFAVIPVQAQVEWLRWKLHADKRRRVGTL